MPKATLIKSDAGVTMSASLDFLLSTLANGAYELVIRRKTKQRTLNQNALMWMWFKCLEDSSGSPKDDWHDYYCDLFLSRPTSIKGRRVSGRTSSLNTTQMAEFLKKVQADAATEWGVCLPLPEDRYYQEFIDHYRTR